MTDDDPTVADVLLPHADEKHVKALRSFVLGGIEAEDLSYEDWVRPMKLTGGRVCLRLDWRDLDGVTYVCRLGNGHLAAIDPPDEEDYEMSPYGVRHAIDHDLADITPVLREDTPFGEVDG